MTKAIKIKKLKPDVPVPHYMSSGAAGFDISAYLPGEQEITIGSGRMGIMPTGLAFEVPEGFEAQVRPRSGLAFKYGISIVNSPGTIDSDYRGEVKVCLINFGDTPFTVRHGDRIAQVVLSEVPSFRIEMTDELSDTERGDSGFGHTGC